MKVSHLIPAGAIALGMLAAHAAPGRLEIVERSFESSTTEVRIPATQNASLTMRHCPDCPSVTLRITPETLFFIDEQIVTQAEFRKAADRGTSGMTVHYLPESMEITRVRMNAS